MQRNCSYTIATWALCHRLSYSMISILSLPTLYRVLTMTPQFHFKLGLFFIGYSLYSMSVRVSFICPDRPLFKLDSHSES